MNIYRFTVEADTELGIRDAAHAELVRFFGDDSIALHDDDGRLVGVRVDFEVVAHETVKAANARGEVAHREINATIEVHW